MLDNSTLLHLFSLPFFVSSVESVLSVLPLSSSHVSSETTNEEDVWSKWCSVPKLVSVGWRGGGGGGASPASANERFKVPPAPPALFLY